MRRLLTIGIPVLVLGGLIAWRLVQNQRIHAMQTAAGNARKNAAVIVRVAPAVGRDIVHTFEGLGNVESPSVVKNAAKVTGRLLYFDLREGERVTRRQVAARIDPS